jgi:hypothetical protein
MDKPAFLYRYRRIDEYLRPILVESEIYFAPVKSFNDPFDCKIRLLPGTDASRMKEYVENMINQYRPDMTRPDREKLLEGIDAGGPEFIQKLLDGVQDDFTNEVGVLSLSAKRDDLLMWSHYSDGHRGVCLEFSMDEKTSFVYEAGPVFYSNEYPTLSFFSDPREKLAKALMTKADRFKYEEEWRIFAIERGAGPHPFDPNILTGVIFGCKVTPEAEQKVRSWVSEGKSKPIFYRASPKPDKFELDIEPY